MHGIATLGIALVSLVPVDHAQDSVARLEQLALHGSLEQQLDAVQKLSQIDTATARLALINTASIDDPVVQEEAFLLVLETKADKLARQEAWQKFIQTIDDLKRDGVDDPEKFIAANQIYGSVERALQSMHDSVKKSGVAPTDASARRWIEAYASRGQIDDYMWYMTSFRGSLPEGVFDMERCGRIITDFPDVALQALAQATGNEAAVMIRGWDEVMGWKPSHDRQWPTNEYLSVVRKKLNDPDSEAVTAALYTLIVHDNESVVGRAMQLTRHESSDVALVAWSSLLRHDVDRHWDTFIKELPNIGERFLPNVLFVFGKLEFWYEPSRAFLVQRAKPSARDRQFLQTVLKHRDLNSARWALSRAASEGLYDELIAPMVNAPRRELRKEAHRLLDSRRSGRGSRH